MMAVPSQLLFPNAQALDVRDVSHEWVVIYQHTWAHGVAMTAC
jgi:hypothetical protein